MRRCTGHCCRCFWLAYSPEELARAIPVQTERSDPPGEIERIVEMVIPLERTPELEKGIEPGGAWGNRYTCKNLLTSGDCGIYATRPRMCRDYPYGRFCQIPGCTDDDVAVKSWVGVLERTQQRSDRFKILGALLEVKEPMGIRALAARVGRKTRRIVKDLFVLERLGRIRIQHPGGGRNGEGERRIGLPDEVRAKLHPLWLAEWGADLRRMEAVDRTDALVQAEAARRQESEMNGTRGEG